jgi:glucokinase
VIGVDLGGSNLRLACFGEDGRIPIKTHREPIGDQRDPMTLVERLAGMIGYLSQLVPWTSGRMPVGVGIAAMLSDRLGTVANSPHLRWRNIPFGQLLAARLGPNFTLGVYNDVNAITWGECLAGAGQGFADVLAVFVGTGIGAGIIANGRLIDGASNCAGELGHVKVAWGDVAAPCACGGRGCVEAYVGGSYVEQRILDELASRDSLAIQLAGGRDRVTPSHVDRAAAEGDEWALGLWTELAPLLAVALGNTLAILNPARLILGGGLLSRTPTLYQQVVTSLTLVAPAASMLPLSIAQAELGDDAGLVGAARLAASGVGLLP